MNNQEIAQLLRQVAAAYLLKGENRFKIIAYDRAAETIQKSSIEARDLWQEGKLSVLPGIGTSIVSYLDELFKRGKVRHFEDALKGLPAALFPLLDISGFGPKKAYKLVTELKLTNPKEVVDQLLKAGYSNRIASIEGFGEKSQEDIIEALEDYKKGQTKKRRMPLPYAYALAEDVINYLKENKETKEAIPLGSLRRMAATIGDIDIAVATNKPQEVVSWFLKYPKKKKVIEKGASGATILLHSGQQIDLRVQNPAQFGSMLQYFTGSKFHNISLREFALKKGLSLSEYGIRPISKSPVSPAGRQKLNSKTLNSRLINLGLKNYNKKLKIYEYSSEKDFYQALELPWIPPELREGSGEIEAAIRQAQGKYPGLPKLIEPQDIKGDFHIHTNYNLEPSHDLGRSSLKEMLIKANSIGYEYIGISDHNPSYSNHTIDQIVSIMKRRKSEYEQIFSSTKSVRVNLLIMLEIDITPDGHLSLPEEAFIYIDAAIVSIHTSFKMSKEKMTNRIIFGLSHPKAKILAHPTGRLINKREGYEVDWSKVFDYCRENHKAIEINAFPDRLDLSDTLVHEAIKRGVKLVINTDSHEAIQMSLMRYGVSVARRGWATKNDIINAMPYNKIKEWLMERR